MAKRKTGILRWYLQCLGLALAGFLLSFGMNLSLENLSRRIPLGFTVPLFLGVVLLGVVSDAVGLASARAKEESLLSMSSRRVAGAREAVWFVRNASRVSSVFSDLMGDVSATLSGALAVAMAFRVRAGFPALNQVYLASAAVGVASFLSVGAKALSKPFALKYAETIILLLGRLRRLWLAALGRTGARR
ncbi:MAG: hypothetical protein WD024_07290 [Bacillota bacterium]